ncbi:uncharacterized protein RHO17_020400 [Thomomys bottae]
MGWAYAEVFGDRDRGGGGCSHSSPGPRASGRGNSGSASQSSPPPTGGWKPRASRQHRSPKPRLAPRCSPVVGRADPARLRRRSSPHLPRLPPPARTHARPHARRELALAGSLSRPALPGQCGAPMAGRAHRRLQGSAATSFLPFGEASKSAPGRSSTGCPPSPVRPLGSRARWPAHIVAVREEAHGDIVAATGRAKKKTDPTSQPHPKSTNSFYLQDPPRPGAPQMNSDTTPPGGIATREINGCLDRNLWRR